jgi:hypothetical protein
MWPLSREEKGAGFWVGKPKGKRIFGRPSYKRKVHVQVYFSYMDGSRSVDESDSGWGQMASTLNMVTEIRNPRNRDNFFTNRETFSFSRGICTTEKIKSANNFLRLHTGFYKNKQKRKPNMWDKM